VATRDTDALILGSKVVLENLLSGSNTVKQIRPGRAMFGKLHYFIYLNLLAHLHKQAQHQRFF
jgi:hypothetical protein